jgi:predicted MFS family arabinose efflux permease
LITAFAIVGALATVPIGILTDRVRRTLLLGLSFLLWSVAVGLVGAAVSFAMLFGVRIALGIVAATSGPTIPSITGDLVPGSERGKARGYVASGQLYGIGIGFALPVLLTPFTSWRWCFWVLAGGGLAMAIAFWRFPEPRRARSAAAARPGADREEQIVEQRHIRPRESAMLHKPPREMSMWEAAKYTVRVKTDLIVLLARAIGDFFFMGIATFAVVFARSWYRISQSEADIAILIIGVGALAGVYTVGRISDALLKQGKLNGRIWLAAASYGLAPAALYPAFLTHSLTVAVPLFALGAFLLTGGGPPLDAVRMDVLVPRLRGRAEAIRQLLRAAAEGGAPALVGFLADRVAGGGTQGLQVAFLVTLPVLLLDGLIMLLALRTYQGDIAAALKSSQEQAEQAKKEDRRGLPSSAA